MARPLHVALLVAFALPLAAAAFPPVPNDPFPGPETDDPAIVGKWGEPFEGFAPAISMALAGNGDIVYWGGVEARDRDHVFFLDRPYDADALMILSPPYDATSVRAIPRPAEMGDFFCAGLTILGDGRILVAGGSSWQDLLDPDYQAFVSGLVDTWAYTPSTGEWEKLADMNWARWYPTVMTDSNGDALALGGIDHLVQPQTMVAQVEGYDGEYWTDLPPNANNILPMYPRIFTVPSGPMKGDLFFETSATLWGPFGEHWQEPLWNLEQVFDREEGVWNFLGPSVFGARQHAATLLLPLDPMDGYTARIMTFGGSLGRSIASTPLAEITTLGADGVSHAIADPLGHPRWHANGVVLPDGSVLAVGGGMYDNVYVHGQPVPAVLVAEQYDPATDTWTDRAPMSVARMYHSSALLLPDGRVLAGGHVPLPVPWAAFRDNVDYGAQVVETRWEIYEPPYLHWGVDRPAIVSLPAAIGFGEVFEVGLAEGAPALRDALLVRPGATTHGWDSNARAVVLPVLSQEGTTVAFRAPPDGDVATPGPWMLFPRVEAAEGIVPGVAAFTTLG